jgi:hypothetical protein
VLRQISRQIWHAQCFTTSYADDADRVSIINIIICITKSQTPQFLNVFPSIADVLRESHALNMAIRKAFRNF